MVRDSMHMVRLALLAVVTVLLVAGPLFAAGGPSFTVQDLATLGGVESYAFAVNNHGEIVGRSFIADGRQRAFLWKDGVMTQPRTAYGTAVAVGSNEKLRVLASGAKFSGFTSGGREQGKERTEKGAIRSPAWLTLRRSFLRTAHETVCRTVP